MKLLIVLPIFKDCLNLSRFDADTSIMNKEIHTPLICAAIRGNFSACKALVSKRASVTDTDANGRNIVHIAADKNHYKFLKVKHVSHFHYL